MHSLSRARLETVNERLKQFRVLSSKFRHPQEIQGIWFHDVARITQLAFKNEPSFGVEFWKFDINFLRAS